MRLAAKSTGGRPARPHVYELDRLRVVTALSVVAVHVLAFTVFLEHGTLGVDIHYAFKAAFHFTREVFMFVTALALAYVYFGRPFAWRHFWRRRGIGVLFPYVAWTVIYVWLNVHPRTVGQFVGTSLSDVITGNASYQLYYILLTLQFYLILPVFLWLLGHIRRHPWKALAVSFAIEVVALYLDYRYIEGAPVLRSSLLQFIATYQDRFVLTYQFFFVLGGLVALHLDQVRAFLDRHRRAAATVMGLALVALWTQYTLQVRGGQVSQDYASAVLQPIMVFYSTAVIAFVSWIAYERVKRVKQIKQIKHAATNATKPPSSQRLWGLLSDATFGIYLVHPLFLEKVLDQIIPHVASFLPSALSVTLTWTLTAAGSIGLSVAMMYTPFLSRLVGRPWRRPSGRIVEAVTARRSSLGPRWRARADAREGIAEQA